MRSTGSNDMVWAGVGVIAVLLITTILLYNRLIRARLAVRKAWVQVDTQLQRRHDLIPSLVATVEGYTDHEREVVDEVVRARAQAVSTSDPAAREVAEDHLGVAVNRLLAVTEDHPDLKADANFRALQTEVAGTEDRIAFAGGFANDRVARYRELTDTLTGVHRVRPQIPVRPRGEGRPVGEARG